MIDFARLFNANSGRDQFDRSSVPMGFDISSLPIIGSTVVDPTSGYSLYDMMLFSILNLLQK